MNIKIDKDIPPPPLGRAPATRYPFADLEVGDSFFIPGATPQSISGSTSWARNKLTPRKFTVRTVEGGTRVWRVA